MKEIGMKELIREDGTFDFKRYQTLAGNYWEHGRFQSGASLLGKSPQPEKKPQQIKLDCKDSITISQESRKRMEEMKENRINLTDMEYVNASEHKFNMTGVVTYVAKLSEVGETLMKQGGAKGASLMGSAYDILRDEIISRYSDPDYQPDIVVEEGGETAHFMTMEEELAILDQAYENIAEFHAVSAKQMAKFKGNYQIAEDIYQRTKEEYLAAREARSLEKLKQKVENSKHVQRQPASLLQKLYKNKI